MKRKSVPLSILFLLISTVSSPAYQTIFTPRISVSEEYTDNLFLLPQNEEHDFITLITPGFTLDVFEKSRGLSLSWDPSISMYNRFSENNTVRQNASLSAWTALAKHTRLELSDSFLRTEDPQRDRERFLLEAEPLIPIDETIRRTREPYWTNAARMNLEHQFGRENFFRLGYLHSLLKNSDPDLEDNQRHTPSAALDYWFSPQLGIKTGISYTAGMFDVSDDFSEWQGNVRLIRRFTKHLDGNIGYTHTRIDFDGDTEDYQIYEPSVGFSYAFAKDTTISMNVGYYLQDKKISDDESGLIVGGNLGKTWALKRGSVNLVAGSGYEQTFFGAENLGFTQYYQTAGGFTYYLTRHLSSNISASYRRNKYLDVDPERTDSLYNLGCGLTYYPIRWMSIGLQYEYNESDSTQDINDYVENRGLLMVTFSQTRPEKPAESAMKPIRP